jgi:SAM-dependent methyltransferase
MAGERTKEWRKKASYAAAVAGDLANKASQRLAAPSGETLTGDRWVEWSFCIGKMSDGPGTTLDFGADIGFLSLGAAQRGHKVVALDRLPSQLTFSHPQVEPLQGDILDRPLGDRKFDQIINCSSVEHVGLGGRYGSFENEDGDLDAMRALRAVLGDGGRMILTIPVGRDLIAAPQHRVYGEQRLPRLLEPFEATEEQYWRKAGRHWTQCDRAAALQTQGSASFYSLGLFVLTGR